MSCESVIMNGNIIVSDLDFGHIRQTQIEEEVVGRGCHVEQLRLPQITSSDAFLKHEMRLAEVSNLLSEYGTSLRSAPISIQFNSYHSEIDSAGLIHSYSPFVCNLNTITNTNRTDIQGGIDTSIHTLMSVVITSSHIVYDDSEAEHLLREVDLVGSRKKYKVNSSSKITCMFRNPDLLVGETQCKSMIAKWAETYGLENKVGDLRKLSQYPAFVINNGESLEIFKYGKELLCADYLTKLELENLFYSYNKLYLKLSQVCNFFNVHCQFLECGLDQERLSLVEMDRFARCLIEANKDMDFEFSYDKRGASRKKREIQIFTSLLETLGLVKTSSQLSLQKFNDVSRKNFNKLKNNQLGLEKALIKQSKELHDLLQAEDRDISTVYDRTSVLSSHIHLLEKFRKQREDQLASFKAFSQAFNHLTESLELILRMGLCPISQPANNVFCFESSCVDTKSMVIRKTKKEFSVAARVLKIQSTQAGRVSCPIIKVGDMQMVHGLQDSLLYSKDKIFYYQKNNMEVTPSCLKTGLNCPEALRPVEARDLMFGNLYFFIEGPKLMLQCLKLTTIVAEHRNYSCSFEPQNIEPPFILVNPNKSNHLIQPHNVHLYISIPREIAHFTQQDFHSRKPAPIPAYNPTQLHQQIMNGEFDPFGNFIHAIIVFTPLSVILLITCFCVILCKYPKLPRYLGKMCVNGFKCCSNVCKKSENSGQCSPPPTAPAAERSPPSNRNQFEMLGPGALPPADPIRERAPFPEAAYRPMRSEYQHGPAPAQPGSGLGASGPGEAKAENVATTNYADNLRSLKQQCLSSGEAVAALGRKIKN